MSVEKIHFKNSLKLCLWCLYWQITWLGANKNRAPKYKNCTSKLLTIDTSYLTIKRNIYQITFLCIEYELCKRMYNLVLKPYINHMMVVIIPSSAHVDSFCISWYNNKHKTKFEILKLEIKWIIKYIIRIHNIKYTMKPILLLALLCIIW